MKTLTAVIFTAFVTQSLTFNYGPSIEFLTRGKSDAVGSTKTRGKTLFLQEFPNKAVVIPLLDGKPSADAKISSKFFTNFHFARFFVEAPRNYRIAAVIQSLHFATSSGTQSKCLDHIGFYDTNARKGSTKICGTVNRDDMDHEPEDLIGPRYFLSTGADLAVDVLILSSSIRNSALRNLNDQLTLEIAFTAFLDDADCNNVTTPTLVRTMQSCNPPNFASERFAVTECIPTTLFCDGVMNCAASTDVEFAYDEQNCTELRQLEASFYDIDESNAMAEIRYRRKLAEMSENNDQWMIHYVVLGLAGVVIGILVFSCLCYWGIWLFPSNSKDENSENNSADIHEVTIQNHELGINSPSEKKLGFAERRFRSQSLSPLAIPATLKVNPDGSHSIEAYHGNRRLTISVN